MLAATAQDLDHLRHWLPQVISWNLSAQIALPDDLGELGLPAYVEQQFHLHRQLHAGSLVTSVLAFMRGHGPAVAGTIASMRAIQQKRADHLLITRKALNEPGGHCSYCGTFPSETTATSVCSSCGQDINTGYHHVIESCWMAIEQDLPVVAVESDELQYLGGMGCILERDQHPQVMPKPAVATPGLDLVA